jgi:hypothetical protein
MKVPSAPEMLLSSPVRTTAVSPRPATQRSQIGAFLPFENRYTKLAGGSQNIIIRTE